MEVGAGGSGTFVQYGGTVGVGSSAAPSSVIVGGGTSGLYNLSGGLIAVNNAVTLAATGSFVQDTGTLVVSSGLISSGLADGEYIGDSGDGSFDQVGGTNTDIGTLVLGVAFGGNGKYTLGSGSLQVTQDEDIADSGSPSPGSTANFIQTTGTNYVQGAFHIASWADDKGTYTLSGGLLEVTGSGGETVANSGTATFGQTGGTNACNGNLFIANLSGSVGEYSMSSTASLTVSGNEYVGNGGDGSFYEIAGSQTVTDTCTVGGSPGASGFYFIEGGALHIGADLDVANGGSETSTGATGTFEQTGGAVTVAGNLNLGYSPYDVGSYTLAAGGAAPTLSVTGAAVIGKAGSGTFIQTTGNTTIGTLEIGAGVGHPSSYSFSGSGTTTITGNAYIGGGTSSSGAIDSSLSANGAFTVDGNVTLWQTSSALNIQGGNFQANAVANSGVISSTGGNSFFNSLTGGGFTNVGNTSGATANMYLNSISTNQLNIENTGMVSITGGASANTVNSLTISGDGLLNINNGHLFIDYGSGADPVSSIAAYIKSGYNDGGWNGPGIISSNAQTLTNGLRYGIGWADSADQINGHQILSGLTNEIEIKYTLLGDANLDGTVNGSDFSILAANFG